MPAPSPRICYRSHAVYTNAYFHASAPRLPGITADGAAATAAASARGGLPLQGVSEGMRVK